MIVAEETSEPRRPRVVETSSPGATESKTGAFGRQIVSSLAQHKNSLQKPTSRPVGRVSASVATSLLVLLIEAFVVVGCSVVAGIGYHLVALNQLGDVPVFATSGIIVAAICAAILRIRENSQPLRTLTAFDLAKDASIAWICAFSLFLLFGFGLKVGNALSRGAVLSFFVFGSMAITVVHARLPFLVSRARNGSALNRREIILIGGVGDPVLRSLIEEVRAGACPNPQIITFNPQCGNVEWVLERKRVVERALTLTRLAARGEILVASSGLSGERLASLLRGLNPIPRSVFLIPDGFTTQLLHRRASAIGDNVGVEMQNEPFNTAQRGVKRAIDIVVSVPLLVLLMPFFVIIAGAIKMNSRGPVFFRQVRLGYRGRPFNILKFRTMTVLESDCANIDQAGKNDPRTTQVGRWLRKTSVDELPQLWNVLKGEMTLIGPRPHARSHDELYAKEIENYELRQHVKPGITGWAQVHGLRGETKTIDLMYRRIEHDLWYVTNCSLILDAQILVRTVFEVIRQRNAY
jgi:Undecaprenyl-phosphate glucose phosphotransferase